MAKAVFYLSGEKAQHEGNRLLMTSKMIEHGFEKGAVFNLPDGRVEILLEDSQEKIEGFHAMTKRDFVAWVKLKLVNQEAIKKQIGNPGINFSELDFNDDLFVHKLEIFSHSLTFDQIYKGIDVYKNLVDGYNQQTIVQQELIQAIKGLDETLQKKG
jgi:acylphosphatase